MDKKTEKEIKDWVKDKKRQKGEKLTIADEPTNSASVGQIKKEVTIL